MKPGVFRFETLRNVWRSQEDAVKQDIANLQAERRRTEAHIEALFVEKRQVKESLREEDPAREIRTVLEYIQGITRRVEMAREYVVELGNRILQRIEDLKKVRMERMRYDKLKEKHDEEVKYFLKTQEQKENDDFAQRKRNP